MSLLSKADSLVRNSQEAMYAGRRSVSQFNRGISSLERVSDALFGQHLTPYVPPRGVPETLSPGARDVLPGPHNVAALIPEDGAATIVARFNFPNFPNEISDSDSASYSSVQPLYRQGELLGYSGSASRTISFELVFVASILGDGAAGGSAQRALDSEANVKKKVEFLKASQYPDYDNWAPPPRFQLVLGRLLSLFGVITQCSVSWEGPFSHAGALPLCARVNIEFKEVGRVPKSFRNMALGTQPRDFSGPVSGGGLFGGQAQGPATGGRGVGAPSTGVRGQGSAPVSEELGSLSARYESNGDPGRITRDPHDTGGGASYGAYQFSERTGSVHNFIQNQGYSAEFAGLTPGTREFDERWAAVAQRDPQGFMAAQHREIQQQFYEPVMRGAVADLGLDRFKDSPAFQNVVWSTSVQHGTGGAGGVLRAAVSGRDVASMSESDVISAIYAERGRTNAAGRLAHFPRYTGNQVGLRNRFLNERNDALALLAQ